MRIRLICLILTFVSFFDHTLSQRYVRRQYMNYDYHDYDEYPRRRVVPYVAPQSRALEDVPVVGFAVRGVKAVVNWIKCIISCFFNYLTSNLCTQMFPCMYDCFIGQTYVAPEVERKLRQETGRLAYPEGISFKTIFTALRCLKDCATERPIKNWETLSYALYCVADSCICFRLFGQT